MSFVDKIKKFFEEDRSQVDINKNNSSETNLSIEEISEKLEAKKKENAGKVDKLKGDIGSKIKEFDREIEESIEILEKIDLSKRKEQEKIKIINLDNLNLYISHIKRLVEDLEKIENKDTQEYLNGIFSSLNIFNKTSHSAYEKATILIGKELAETRDKIRKFSWEINEIAKVNKPLFDEVKSINNIEILFKEINSNSEYLSELNKNLRDISSSITNSKNEIPAIEKRISQIKESEAYKKDQVEKDILLKKSEELDKKIYSTKERINMKNLAKIYHSDKKKMQVLQNYSSNFRASLEADSELEILKLITDEQHIKELNDIVEEINNLNKTNKTESEMQISSIEDSKRKLQEEISTLDGNLSEETRKKDRLESKNKDLEEQILSISKTLSI